MERLQAMLRQATERPRTRFTIGMVPSALNARFPQIVSRFREELPDVELRLAELDSAEQAKALVDGRIDVGFDRIVVDDPLLRHEIMREEPLVVALPAGDPLLAGGRAIPLADLADRPLLLFPSRPRPSYADHVLATFREHRIVPTSIVEVRELQTALVMVAAGSGICVVPETVTRAARPDIGFAPLAEAATIPLLIRFRRHDRSPAFRALLKVYEALHREWGWPFPAALAADIALGQADPDR
jgi:LysR family transcriptional regulator, benzoate and cis,cis-muconate-responsive activator of ben and cat genes